MELRNSRHRDHRSRGIGSRNRGTETARLPKGQPIVSRDQLRLVLCGRVIDAPAASDRCGSSNRRRSALSQKRRNKELRRRRKIARKPAVSASSKAGSPYDEIVPCLGENGQPMRRLLKCACDCGGDLAFVEDSQAFASNDQTWTIGWQRQCTRCEVMRMYSDTVEIGPPDEEQHSLGPLLCERCETQLSANPGEPPALNGTDWYCHSCESDGGEALPPGCTATRPTATGELEYCMLDRSHEGQHGEWGPLLLPCRSVVKDENGIPIQCLLDADHGGDHEARGSYSLEIEGGEYETFTYELRWTGARATIPLPRASAN